MAPREIFVGNENVRLQTGTASGEYVSFLGERYYRIGDYDRMPPFFMSVVSGTDHWLFISSTGGLTAGRVNSDSALFPYYTDDRVTENSENTGGKAILLVERGERRCLWEPLSSRYQGLYRTGRNLYKNVYGDRLVFEETNEDLGLAYRVAWRTSERYGLVRTTWVQNTGDEDCSLALVDGLQNLLPYGANAALQSAFSNLLNGYKRNELDRGTGLGMFSLSSSQTDLAEPSESLKATTVWQVGLRGARRLLSANQLDAFRRGEPLQEETDIRGRRGAYLVNADLTLEAGEESTWHIVAEVNQDSSAAADLLDELRDPATLRKRLEADIQGSSADLVRIIAAADGLQLSGDYPSAAHHYANALFNTMRGGIFADGYAVDREELRDFLATRNRAALARAGGFVDGLPADCGIVDLYRLAAAEGPDIERLCREYLPLTFSRRHGDPSRPWNVFSINLKKADGSRKLDYQGNWRDIFQNWEPLAFAYPDYIENMICKFVNATTADGYNPYRVTRDGIEWEVPEPDNPWANIGYWSDHQIIYLQKLLELSVRFHPNALPALMGQKIFCHANVPYRIKPYAELLEDWYDTIDFDWDLNGRIEEAIADRGTDARLLPDANGGVFRVNLTEKLLVLLLAKLSNFVPEGGIWMNTQRPEWNDANNALVGKGLSVVTACYLRRFVAFWRDQLADAPPQSVELTQESMTFFAEIEETLQRHADGLEGNFDDAKRRVVMDALGEAGSAYRWTVYKKGLCGEFGALDGGRLLAFLERTLAYIEHTLRANRREDGLYHAYNILRLGERSASFGHLYEMLEGQVAILSSGLLAADQALDVVHSLRRSRMYREDQHSYILYPDRDLAGFLDKNRLLPEQVGDSALVAKLAAEGDATLIIKDRDGLYHFNGAFRNAKDVARALEALKGRDAYGDLVEAEGDRILALFEEVFDHSSFTGRSGTFFAFEGLGSIYWHMVSKLLLAVQETFLEAVADGEDRTVQQGLATAYYDVRRGIGFNKTPAEYGAFPTDPYSHTPAGEGAKQPGMTGQVKEELLTRMGEMGLSINDGAISFHAALLRPGEFSPEPAAFDYIDVQGRKRTLELPANALAFTLCQVPIVRVRTKETAVEVHRANGDLTRSAGTVLDAETSAHVFGRNGLIDRITVYGPAGLEEQS